MLLMFGITCNIFWAGWGPWGPWLPMGPLGPIRMGSMGPPAALAPWSRGLQRLHAPPPWDPMDLVSPAGQLARCEPTGPHGPHLPHGSPWDPMVPIGPRAPSHATAKKPPRQPKAS